MSNPSQNQAWRRLGSRRHIDRLLTQRRRMLVSMCEVLELKPFTVDKPVHEALQDFTQMLVDYVAAGHFNLYHRIVTGRERRQTVAQVASRVYQRIATTSDAAMDFNDRYGGEWNFHLLDKLAGDLSAMGEQLATRVELEDQIIIAMLGEQVLRDQAARPDT
jgi:regulator of sigma D